MAPHSLCGELKGRLTGRHGAVGAQRTGDGDAEETAGTVQLVLPTAEASNKRSQMRVGKARSLCHTWLNRPRNG
jgi:hypothetical protein